MITFLLISLMSFFQVEKPIINADYSHDKFLMEIPASLMGKELIFTSVVVATSDENETFSGYRPCPYEAVTFQVVDSTVFLYKINDTSFETDKESNIDRAIKESNAPSVIYSTDLLSISEDGSYKCDFTSFFIKDRKYFHPKDIKAYNGMDGFVVRDYSFNSGSSSVAEISPWEGGISVYTHLSYNVSRSLFAISEIVKNEPFTAVVKSSFYLPDDKSDNYQPLKLNPNLGVGSVSLLSYDESYQGSKKLFYATRWKRVEDKPIITFYVDSLLPVTLLNSIYSGALMWNKCFEELNLGKAIELITCDFSKNDRNGFATIRYSRSKTKTIRSMIVPNPRTGEILNADIIVGADILTKMKNEVHLRCANIYPELIREGKIDQLMEKPLSSDFAYHFGKCLGLLENNTGSYDIPVDSLRSATYTAENGISNSVMDIQRVNSVATDEEISKGVLWYIDRVGIYDKALVKWLYGDNQSDISYSNYLFGNKYSSKKFSDPRAVSWDMGSDNLYATHLALNNIYSSIDNICLLLDSLDYDYSYRKDLVDFVVEKYFHYANPALQNIGGVYIHNNNSLESDKYEFVPKNRQKESLLFLLNIIRECNTIDNPHFTKYADLNTSVSDFISKEFFSTILTKISEISPLYENPFSRAEGIDVICNWLWDDNKNSVYSLKDKRMQIDFVKTLCKLSRGDDVDVSLIDKTRISLMKKMEKKGFSSKKENEGHNRYLLSILKNVN